ncbi:MAG: hypothetical protein V1792_08450 [Pseudomonadota bacterium]
MPKALKYILAVLVGVLAVYGAVTVVSGFLFTESRGRAAAKTAQPFVNGMTSAMKDQAKQRLTETPDAKLEKEAYEISRKMYPVVKGTLLGQADAFAKDPNRDEISARVREAGKILSEQMVGPFAEGVAEGSGKVFRGLDQAAEGVRKFQDKNKDVVESLTNTLGQLKQLFDRPPPAPQPPQSPYTGPPPGVDRNSPVPVPMHPERAE